MPLYVFECSEHGKFEELKKKEERYSHPCPECKQECPLVLSPFSFNLRVPAIEYHDYTGKGRNKEWEKYL